MVPVSMTIDLLVGFSRVIQTVVAGSVAFALSYLLVRFALVRLVRWATAGETDSWVRRYGSTVAKVLAFVNAVAFSAGFAQVDVPWLWTSGAAVVFVLGCGVYRFECLLETRELGA